METSEDSPTGKDAAGEDTPTAADAASDESLTILWLRPDKPDNISVGRHRIADELEAVGHTVEVWNTTFTNFWAILSADPDVVVGTTRLGALVGTWKHLLDGTPFVVDHIDPIAQLRRKNGRLKTWLVKRLENFAFSIADHVMVVYEEERPRVAAHATAVTKTELGVDFDAFANPPEDVLEAARDHIASIGYPERQTLIYVGGINPAYNIDTILEAMDLLDGWQFLVLGDGSQRDLVETVASDREDVLFPGTVPHEDIPGYLHVSDVGICLLDDRNTLKLLEYGAARLPTVSIEGDPEAKFEGLVEFCANDPADVALAVRTAATDAPVDEFQAFTRQFGWDAIADEYCSVFRSVIADSGAADSR